MEKSKALKLPLFYRLSSAAYFFATLPSCNLVPKSTILYLWIWLTSYMNDQKHLFRKYSPWKIIDKVSATVGLLNLLLQFTVHSKKVSRERLAYFFTCVLVKLNFFRLSRTAWKNEDLDLFFHWHACWHYSALLFSPCIKWVY